MLISQLDDIFCPVFGDILLYTEEARSLADSGTLKFSNFFGVSGAYLYPLCLSIIYKYFYNAYGIVFRIRAFGVLAMTSTIFPSYLLLDKMELGKKEKITLATASVLIPDMMQTMLPVTEVLAYPLYMWTLYVFYNDASKENNIWTSAAVSMLSYIDYMTRGQALVIAIAYVFTGIVLILMRIREQNINRAFLWLKKIAVFTIIFFALYCAVPRIMERMNIIADVSSSESSFALNTITKLQTNPWYYLRQWGKGALWYAFFILFSFGFFVVVIPLSYKEYPEKITILSTFVYLSLLLTIGIVVLIIYSMEEPLEYDTHRVHIRYFMYYFAPLLFLTYRTDFDKIKSNCIMRLMTAFFAVYALTGRYVYSIRENYFLGAEGIPLTVVRILKEKLSVFPWLESITVIGTAALIVLSILFINRKGWKKMLTQIVPVLLIVASLSNIVLYDKRDRYLKNIGMGDYVSRYAPTADYISQFDAGEVVLLISKICDDNEMQTFQVMCKKSVDVISRAELDEEIQRYNGAVELNRFERCGYYYISETRRRILSEAKYFVCWRPQIDGIYSINNEIVFSDANFNVYALDNGVLNIQAIN